MCKRIVIGLLHMSVITVLMAMLGTEAEAGICTNCTKQTGDVCTAWKTIGSTKYCSCWCTGSEICDNLILGLPSSTAACSVTTCSVFGTVGSLQCEDRNVLEENCEIEGIALCLNPQDKFNPQGTAFNLPGILTAVTGDTTCTKGGKCTNFAELDPEDTGDICNNNWTFLTFTAREFKGESCFCPGGYDLDPQFNLNAKCCNTCDRNMDGSCQQVYGDGTPACIRQFCEVNLSNYQRGDNLLYTCTRIP